jgi:hypothetical protein
LDDEALRCIEQTAERTGVDEGDLLSCIVKEWYQINSDTPAECLMRDINLTRGDIFG